MIGKAEWLVGSRVNKGQLVKQLVAGKYGPISATTIVEWYDSHKVQPIAGASMGPPDPRTVGSMPVETTAAPNVANEAIAQPDVVANTTQVVMTLEMFREFTVQSAFCGIHKCVFLTCIYVYDRR